MSVHVVCRARRGQVCILLGSASLFSGGTYGSTSMTTFFTGGSSGKQLGQHGAGSDVDGDGLGDLWVNRDFLAAVVSRVGAGAMGGCHRSVAPHQPSGDQAMQWVNLLLMILGGATIGLGVHTIVNNGVISTGKTVIEANDSVVEVIKQDIKKK